ncbi:MAG: phosphotransferase [Marinosulfonomonas sp.]|nr:phosphotransferase [Marinosulfonomonas sp.]
MNDAEAIAYARGALRAWEVPDCTPRLIKNRENAVFEVVAPDGGRAALRLHRPGYQTNDAIRSELIWMQELADAGMELPRPIPSRCGDLISAVPQAGRMASIVSWVDGVPLGDGGISDEWSEEKQMRLFTALGAELAKLHRLSDGLVLPDNFERAQLGICELLGDNPNWGRFWENPALTDANKTLLLDARRTLAGLLEDYQTDGAGYGLIHADALSENVLVVGGTVTLIDFDDGVFGFRMYELGVAMSQVWDRAGAQKLATALGDGYGLGPEQAKLLPAFTVIRTLASCGWTISRYAPDDPALIGYADRAVRAATRFMAGEALFAG